jgi:hypothetical protein
MEGNKVNRYKDPQLQAMYEGLVRLGSPEKLKEKKIWGAVASAFTQGYNGLPATYEYRIRGSFTYAAYYAGKESKRIASLSA